MKIFSWNVNGIRAVLRKGDLQKFIDKYHPDVLCLQEIKAREEQVDYDFPGYKVYWNPAKRAGYSGTAMLISDQVKVQNFVVWGNMTAVAEGRVQVADMGDFLLVNVYTPNSKPNLERLPFRELEWDPRFLQFTKALEERLKPVVMCGDFNAAHEEIDLARPKENQRNAGFTRVERRGISNIIKAGFVDTFRSLHPEEQRYTWWSHWGHARENNVGWRIDYFFVSGGISDRVKDAEIFEGVSGSDHCPIAIELEI